MNSHTKPEPVNARLLAALKTIEDKITRSKGYPVFSSSEHTKIKNAIQDGAEAEAQPTQSINQKLLRQLKGARLDIYAARGDKKPSPEWLRDMAKIDATIAEAEAQAKPDAPSYDVLLDGDRFLRYQSRALLKRARREG